MLYSLLSAMDTVKTVGKILVWIAIFGGLFFVLFYLPNKREKAYQEEKMKTLSSLKVGTEIETIGGILGKIVEIDEATGTFVIETGSEEHKGYIKIQTRAIYNVLTPESAPVVEPTTEETPVEETPVEEPFEETVAEETPVEETATEEAVVEETAEETPVEEEKTEE